MVKNLREKIEIMGEEKKNLRKTWKQKKNFKWKSQDRMGQDLKVKKKKNHWMELTTDQTQQKKVLMDPKTVIESLSFETHREKKDLKE